VFRESFKRAGLPYFNPHSLRNTLVRLGLQRCQGAEELKAWSQNLGHEQVLTTLMSYGKVAGDRQGEIIRGLGETRNPKQSEAEDIAEAVFRKLQSAGASSLVAR
jgi:integrase